MPTVELLAKVCNICAEVSKNEIVLFGVFEPYSSDCWEAVHLCRNRLDW